MRCPRCKFISFDHLDTCKRCGAKLGNLRQELCPNEVASGSMSAWTWLGLGTVTNPSLEETPTPAEAPPEVMQPIEIRLDEAVEEVILDDEIIMEESQPPSEELDLELFKKEDSAVTGETPTIDETADYHLEEREAEGGEGEVLTLEESLTLEYAESPSPPSEDTSHLLDTVTSEDDEMESLIREIEEIEKSSE